MAWLIMLAMRHLSVPCSAPPLNSRRWLAAIALTMGLAALSGCGQQVLADYPTVNGERLTAPIGILNQVTLSPPKGWQQIEPQTWALSLGQDRVLVMKANLATGIEGGADSFVDKQLQEIGKLGQGGTERDERALLGDLDARLIRVVDLRNRPPIGLWMMVVEAEDGLFTLTVLGPLDDLRKHSAAIETALQSLRIAPPVGVTREAPKRPAIEDDLPAPPSEPSPGKEARP